MGVVNNRSLVMESFFDFDKLAEEIVRMSSTAENGQCEITVTNIELAILEKRFGSTFEKDLNERVKQIRAEKAAVKPA